VSSTRSTARSTGISEEIDWRDPNLEWRWFDWADARLGCLLEVLEGSYRLKRRDEVGLRLVV
jgi:hypothetical protein